MKKYNLIKFLKIIGLSTVSALTYQNDVISLIADNSNVLYEYNIKDAELTKITLSEGEIENIAKKDKLDFESMIDSDKSTYIFGSGSNPNREKAVYINKDKNTVETLNLNYLFDSMKSFAEISENDLNIEGVAYANNEWYFLNRGNGPGNKNIIFTVQGNNLVDDFNLFFNEFELPEINKIKTGFSDGIVIKNKLYFIATAENSDSTYNDGKIEGTLFGCINLKKMKLEYTQIISTENKFEGITLYELKGKNAVFLLGEDEDNENNQTDIYKLEIKL
ncbi:DUF6929 family protein [Flavobacterium sp. I3-2]|uniref:DUF6929 family protein n=1 Tax=Flavobacterium sp. I3-2 TaxID=2748319 RepID=UPI0015AB6B32|nr:hypothetical protein [Flavobacterium sp. I3-2]